MADLPEGFAVFERSSPFLDLVGPLYAREEADGGITLGLRIEERHCNRRGLAHGGLLVTLADLALGYGLVRAGGQGSLATANLTVDFAGAAKLGQWIEARADVQKAGGALNFASCHVVADGRRIVRASGIFAAPKGKH